MQPHLSSQVSDSNYYPGKKRKGARQANPVSRTYVRGYEGQPFEDVQNIYSRPSRSRPELGPKVASGSSDSYIRGVLSFDLPVESLQVEREALDGCYGVKAMDVVNQEDQEIKGSTGNLVVHTLLMIPEAP